MNTKLCNYLSTILISLTLLVFSASAQIATGGTYTLKQSVIANGGGTSIDVVNNNYSVRGTSGQSAAGTNGTGGTYSVRNGFWSNLMAPTAANVSVGGRVLTENGMGIRNSMITLTGGNLTTPLVARSSSFGYFKFDDVEVGQVYVVTVLSKSYGFAQSTQVVLVTEDLTDLVFRSTWSN